MGMWEVIHLTKGANMFSSDRFKIKIEWTYHAGWNVKVFKQGYCVPVAEVNNSDIKQAMDDVTIKLIEYLESESE